MSSEHETAEVFALLVTGGSPAALVPGLRSPGLLVLTSKEAASLAPFPSNALVLLADPAPNAEHVARLARVARRNRNPGWFVFACDENVARARKAWMAVTDEHLEPPVAESTIRALSAACRSARAMERKSVQERRRARSAERRLAVLTETLRAAGALLDPRMVSRFIMQRAATIVRSSWWRLYRLDDSRGTFRLDAHVEPGGISPPAEWLPIDRGLAGVTARSREVVHVRNAERDPRVDRLMEWPHDAPSAVIAAPMISRGRVIGVIELAEHESGRFTARDVELIRTLMEPAAIALDNAELFRKLEERTVTDDLTQLYNGRFMENYLRREAKRAVRYGHPVALLFIDLDGFKQVNDVHGHMAGSRTLIEVGDVLRRNVREIDVVARWGGDEFAVVLPDTSAEGAVTMAERIRERISEERYLGSMGLEVRVSASIGVAAYPRNGTDAEQLLAAADGAMYEVKNSGKNGVKLADPVAEALPAGV